MKTYTPPAPPRKTQQERVAEMEAKKQETIREFRNRTQQRDLARMLKNMAKVGMKSTGVPSLDAKLHEIDPTIIVDDLDKIRLNMLRTGNMTSGDEWVDEKLVEKFGPIESWLDEIKSVMLWNKIEKCGLPWLDFILAEKFGPRDTWKLL
jgi:hypothetical protein